MTIRDKNLKRKAQADTPGLMSRHPASASARRRTPTVCRAPGPSSLGDHLPMVAPAQRIDPGLLLELFGQSPITFNRIYIDITGSVPAALWLAYAIYHVCERETAPSNWFSKSQERWTLETGLSRREQENARNRLRILGILEEERSPNSPLAYRIAITRLYALMEIHSREIRAQYLAARSVPEQ
jgi:hypothetical protein